MTREALLRELRRIAKVRNLELVVSMRQGKGSYCRVALGDRKTIIPSGELTPLHVRTIKRRLGIE